jgi:hypothetical protein
MIGKNWLKIDMKMTYWKKLKMFQNTLRKEDVWGSKRVKLFYISKVRIKYVQNKLLLDFRLHDMLEISCPTLSTWKKVCSSEGHWNWSNTSSSVRKSVNKNHTCTRDMHEHACREISKIRQNGSAHQSLKVGPYQGQKWLFWAMDGSPTMDVLTHHGY